MLATSNLETELIEIEESVLNPSDRRFRLGIWFQNLKNFHFFSAMELSFLEIPIGFRDGIDEY
jgi:hypothetical protein